MNVLRHPSMEITSPVGCQATHTTAELSVDRFQGDVSGKFAVFVQLIKWLILNFTVCVGVCVRGVRMFAHGAMGRRIDPSWWTH